MREHLETIGPLVHRTSIPVYSSFIERRNSRLVRTDKKLPVVLHNDSLSQLLISTYIVLKEANLQVDGELLE